MRGENSMVSPIFTAAWRPAGLIYLGVCLAALGVGIVPQAIYPAEQDVVAAPRPTLQTLAVAQSLAILLLHPLATLARSQRGAAGRYWLEIIVESAAWLIVTAPFYTAAAWLADATAGDVARTVLYVLSLWPLSWSAGAILRSRPGGRTATILLLLIVASMPAAWYVTREFLRPISAEWLWQLGPPTFAWQAAASRTGAILPRPLWALIVWPATAAVLAALSVLPGPRQKA